MDEEKDKLYNIDYKAIFDCNVVICAKSEEEAKERFHGDPIEYLSIYDEDDPDRLRLADEREIYSIYEVGD